MSALDVLSLENPVFRKFLFYNSILILKMMLMSLLTARQRFKNKAFANPEDAAAQKVKPKVDDDVERVRRAHLNDLENIPIFTVASFCYLLTNPSATLAIALFRAFTAARIMHTIVYAVYVVPQPARGLSWGIGYLITGYMAVQSILHFLAHLNDLENIPIFVVASLGFLMTNPSVWLATTLFRAYTAARIAHTFVYAVHVVPQPARALAWGVGYFITGYMAVQTAMHFC